MTRFLTQFKRIGLDLIALFSIILVAIFVPNDIIPLEIKIGLSSLFLTKFFLVSAAIIHAHITRKLLFPYINLSVEQQLPRIILIISWYVIIIFAWSRGG